MVDLPLALDLVKKQDQKKMRMKKTEQVQSTTPLPDLLSSSPSPSPSIRLLLPTRIHSVSLQPRPLRSWLLKGRKT